MAKIEIIIAKLPALIADRTDSLKLETAIRYVGDIIFDASQNPRGDKAKALAGVLSSPASTEEVQSREAILTLFRDGYLDRYADYIAFKDIARAAGISSDPARMDPFNQESATGDTPRVVVLTGMLKAPTASIEGAGDAPENAKPVEALKLRTPTLRKNEPTRRLKTANEMASNEAAGKWVRQAPRESNESYSVGVPLAGSGREAAARTRGATPSLEIISLEGPNRSPIEFARNFRENPTDKFSEMGFPCLIGFVPKISTDERSVEWANPVTADGFRDHGDRLTSGSPNRLAIRAMLELARAGNWNRVAVKGTVRLQAFAEDTAAELDRLLPIGPGRGTADRSFHEIPRPSSVVPRRGRLSRVIWMSASLLVLVLMGFLAAYIYSNPQLQTQLGIKSLIDTLPWKHEELLADALANPLKFEMLSLALSTRSGDLLSPPKAAFIDTELTNAGYLGWDALFENRLAGFSGRDEKIAALFYAPSGLQIALSWDEHMVDQAQKTVSFSSVAWISERNLIKPGDYKVSLYLGGQMLAEERFTVTEVQAAKETGEMATKALSASSPSATAPEASPTARSEDLVAAAIKAKAAAAAASRAEEEKQRREAQRLAMIQERMSRPLQLETIDFVNSAQDGTVLSGPSGVFNVSKVLFVAWRVIFENRLAGLDTNQYRVDATYLAPDGSTMGSVDDVQIVGKDQRRAVFSGRVGNAAGGAFLPGQYTVNFYLNGRYVAQRRFRVVLDAVGSGSAGANLSGFCHAFPALCRQ